VSVFRGDDHSDVLRTVRLTGALFFLWDVGATFATPVPAGREFAPVLLPGAQEILSYHIVSEGACFGALPGGEPVPLAAGDILLVPRGDAYVIASSERACRDAGEDAETALAFFSRMAAGELPFVVDESGGAPPATRLVCGFLGCDVRPFNPVLAALPPLMRVARRPDAAGERLASLIELTLAEARAPRAGSGCVLVRLGELLFVEVVRRCLAEAPAARRGWLAALADPVAGRALELLHRRPAAAWTLEGLAGEVATSRTRLAESFAQLVGQPPMQYLASWRMQLAARALADGRAKVAAVAREVGYDSEAAFSRAFKRATGVSPAAWRRVAAAGAPRQASGGR